MMKYILLDDSGRCRWSTNSGEPILFTKYENNRLNILDIEKKVSLLKEPIQFEKEGNCGLQIKFEAIKLISISISISFSLSFNTITTLERNISEKADFSF